MDTSETYIKMSDCLEIQQGHTLKRWEPTGDPYDVTAQTYNSDHYYTGNIWLPRQDQLQAMIGDYATCLELIDRYDQLSSLDCDYPNVTSMEQLWMGIVMKELHNKVWEEDRWVK